MEKEQEEKPEKKQEKKQDKKETKVQSGKAFFGWGSFILLFALIIIVLIVFQVPYITTNAIVENVPVEKCVQEDIPSISSFKIGSTYGSASKIYSSDGEALYKYSELKNYIYANIRNVGEEKGIYCVNIEAYLIPGFDFNDDENTLTLFQSLLAEDSAKIQTLENWNSERYDFPICTENPIRPVQTETLSFWAPSLLSEEAKGEYNLDDVYILLSIIPPTLEQCDMEYEEKTTEQEVTRYCNAWKHLVGKC